MPQGAVRLLPRCRPSFFLRMQFPTATGRIRISIVAMSGVLLDMGLILLYFLKSKDDLAVENLVWVASLIAVHN